MNSLSNNVPNIPLKCNVCPKKPDFSDVSHLLTHIASKGHLSAYYKMKVKGSTDSGAKNIVDGYDEWYEEWSVEDLMRDRMNQKEKKRGTGTASTYRRGSGANSNSARSTPRPSLGRASRSTRPRDSMHLDPQLYRNEQASRSGTPASVMSMDAASFPRASGPPMQNWAPRGPNGMGYEPHIKQESVEPTDDDDESYESVPRRSTRSRRHQPSPSNASLEEIDNGDLANDITKLKGIFWPGMDMFDSATPEMRRKRNQKKNASVLKSLQATSEVVEPTESVFSVDMVLLKERIITGNPESDDSLLPGESEPEPDLPKKKRAVRRPRPALVNKDVNTGLVYRDRRQSHHPPFGRPAPTHNFKEEDNDMAFGPPRPSQRTGLSIHRDNSGPDITFDQPAPMNYLTSGFRNPFSFNGNNFSGNLFPPQQNIQNNLVPRTHSRQQSWGQVNGGFRPSAQATAISSQNFPNFTQYFNQSAGQQNPGMAGHHTHASYPQHMGMGSQNFPGSNPVFQPGSGTSWDFLGLGTDDMDIMGGAGNLFPAGGEMNTANPLFFSSNKEDDETTMSAGEDDR